MADFKSIKKSCWINFLKHKGCIECDASRHVKWKCPGCFRSIIFRNAPKEIPFAHIHTNLMTMNISSDEFSAWIKINC